MHKYYIVNYWLDVWMNQISNPILSYSHETGEISVVNIRREGRRIEKSQSSIVELVGI